MYCSGEDHNSYPGGGEIVNLVYVAIFLESFLLLKTHDFSLLPLRCDQCVRINWSLATAHLCIFLRTLTGYYVIITLIIQSV